MAIILIDKFVVPEESKVAFLAELRTTVCPAVAGAYSKNICPAVTATIGTEAASIKLRCFGFGAILPANCSEYSVRLV